jgi:hypothetical protein
VEVNTGSTFVGIRTSQNKMDQDCPADWRQQSGDDAG